MKERRRNLKASGELTGGTSLQETEGFDAGAVTAGRAFDGIK